MLDRLPDAQHAKLQPLLKELQALGIPKIGVDAALIGKNPGAEPITLDAAELAVINNADASEIGVLLQNEPPQVIAAILSIHDWDWHAWLLKQFSQERRQSVARAVELGRRNGMSSRLRNSILASLARLLHSTREQRLLDQDPRETAYQRRPGVLGRIWRSLWPA